MTDPIILVTLFSIATSFLFALPYKFLMDQQKVKLARERVNELNKKIKESRKSGDTKEASKLMSEVVSHQGVLMKNTTRPMIVTLLIVLIILPLFSQYYIASGSFSDDSSSFLLRAVSFGFSRTDDAVTFTPAGHDPVTIGLGESALVSVDNTRYQLTYRPEENLFFIIHRPAHPEAELVVGQSLFPLPFTGTDFGWLAWYIIVGIPFNILLRKILKVNV